MAITAIPALASGGGEDDFDRDFYSFYSPHADELPSKTNPSIGIIPPKFSSYDLFFTYRVLHQHPLSQAEIIAANEVDQNAYDSGIGEAAQKWLDARKPFVTEKDERYPSQFTYKTLPSEDGSFSFNAYNPCLAPAFEKAVETLHERQKTASPAWLSLWLAGQDTVFKNCSNSYPKTTKSFLPPPLPSDAPTWLVYDHDYQTAAALFYGEEFDRAAEKFQAIANNSASVWQKYGAFMVLRSQLRAITLGQFSDDAVVKLKELSKKFRQLAKTYPPALNISHWIDTLFSPQKRMLELGRSLTAGPINSPETRQDLYDLFYILGYRGDTIADDNFEKLDKNALYAQIPMLYWINQVKSSYYYSQSRWGNFQGDFDYQSPFLKSHPSMGQIAEIMREKSWGEWLKTKDEAWLIPYLMNIENLSVLTKEQNATLLAVPTTSPAWHMINYHYARMLLSAKQSDEAGKIINRALSLQNNQPGKDNFGLSANRPTRNSWMDLKFYNASTEKEFLQAIPRQFSQSAIDYQQANKIDKVKNFDDNAEWRMLSYFPLPKLADFYQRSDVPKLLRDDLVYPILARALMKKDWQLSKTMMDAMIELTQANLNDARKRAAKFIKDYPDRKNTDVEKDSAVINAKNRLNLLKSAVKRLNDADNPEAREVAVALLVIFEPLILSHYTPFPYPRDNSNVIYVYDTPSETDQSKLPPRFLSQAELADRAQEQANFKTEAFTRKWLADHLIPWAKAHPNDPDLPRAFHYYIYRKVGWHVGYVEQNPNDAPRNDSRDAFRLMHKLWPKDPWTKITKYWY